MMPGRWRVPFAVLFGVAAAIQLALIAAMVIDRARILRTGTEVMLRSQPVDPRDLLRGDYVTLTYDISSLPAGPLKGTPVKGRHGPLYVTLARQDDGFYRASAVTAEPGNRAPGEIALRGRLSRGGDCGDERRSYCDTLTLEYGLERYFVPEGEGRELESARNQRRISVIAAVTPSGRAAIKRLLLDGKPIYEEPLF